MKVVFQITSGDADVQLSMLGQLHNLLAQAAIEQTSLEVEVVVHGQAWNLLLPTANPLAEKVRLLQERTVLFIICANTLRGREMQLTDLLPGIALVPAAIFHLVKRQQEGWAYIRC
ncbi:hypothetical protein FHW36_11044 [Chitinophaga polysaccharea]|uniref:Uncharacterized protein n=1 Tax=Chitinophaga polysaccharea TaxID=1293035 RepID=A0A561P9Y1_9BACT|nr:DsrE family protein [Chitinophaga polysaccharea]TWF34846.1 hypothetical protein FHW36_11044 [Chitinophaga polysaccharea]